MSKTTAQRRGLPEPGPGQALGRGLASIEDRSKVIDYAAWAHSKGLQTVTLAPRRDFLAAGAAAAVVANRQAAEAERVVGLDERIADLEAEVRGLRAQLDDANAERDRAVAEAERRGRHEALGEARLTVAGHTMPSIRSGS